MPAMSASLPEAAQRVQAALQAAGLDASVVELPASTRTAQEAAAAIGCRVEQIAKSLVFRGRESGQPLLVIASGSNRVDERRVGARFGQEIERADPDFVRSSTGYAIGGVPPVAHRAPIVTLIDADLLPLPVVWAAAGTPHAVFSVTPADLVAATGGEVVDVARR
jgi:prolyl-tRNA editing enzyme YbaK/EbsC (Cys-tRNA(Pro) deacylase)